MRRARIVGPRVMRRLPDGVEAAPYRCFDLAPRGVTIGAQIGGLDLRAPLEGDVVSELWRALLEWKVLFFRDQHLAPEQHVAFARHFGELEAYGVDRPLPEWLRFEKGGDAVDPTRAGFENVWHSDVTWRPDPVLGSILRCVEGPPHGGDTLFADMCAAYDQLSPELRARAGGLAARHSLARGLDGLLPPDRLAAVEARHPDRIHPVIGTHPETGRPLIYVNPLFTKSIEGLPPEESDALLDALTSLASMPELQVRWQWRPGDVAFWDNRATQHYACSDYWPQRRVTERVSIRERV